MEGERMSYVAGFLYSPDLSKVVLIRKERPEWQAGYLNGVGGKVEFGESAKDAMEREFLEEAGLRIKAWRYMLCLSWKDKEIHYFCAAKSPTAVSSRTDERLEIHSCNKLPEKIISNLKWLVPLGRYLLANPSERIVAR